MPLGLSRVKDPRGVVDWDESTDDVGNSVDLAVCVEVVDTVELLSVLVRLRFATEGGWEPVALVGVDVPFGEANEVVLSCLCTAGDARDTIFIPRLVLVLAGMNKVVERSGPGMAIR